jgi:hypothetical protein
MAQDRLRSLDDRAATTLSAATISCDLGGGVAGSSSPHQMLVVSARSSIARQTAQLGNHVRLATPTVNTKPCRACEIPQNLLRACVEKHSAI